MGVTLERVQFKFASIIGELCSEPDILSQFAVWVDLRLAEYKLKGSISLDCSGDPPDPVWLKGILSALLEKRLQKHAQMTAGSPISNQQLSIRRPLCHSTPISQRNWGNSEGSGPGAPLPPVKINLHDQIRKRRAWEAVDPLTSTSEESDDNPNKSRKRGTEEDPITISHESLMSVIGLSSYDNSTVTDGSPVKTEPGRQPHVIEENELNPVPEGERCAQIRNSEEDIESYDLTHCNSPYEVKTEHCGIVQEDPILQTSLMNMYGRFTSPDRLHVDGSTYSFDERNNGRAIKHTSQHVRNSNSAVAIFSRWFQQRHPDDTRKVEEIEPEELDNLLADFYATVKKRDGGEYYPRSLHLLRTCLESYLKKAGYPCSLVKSPLFSKSTHAFKLRKKELELKQSASMRPTS